MADDGVNEDNGDPGATLRDPVQAKSDTGRARVTWVADGTVLVFVTPDPQEPQGTERAGARRARDHQAGRTATATAIAAVRCRFGPESVGATSRAHSEGRAVAVASVHSRPLGIDLVRLGRIDTRGLRAISTPHERYLLRGWGALSPAIAWAAKEACVKAFGSDRCRGVTGVRLTVRAGRLLAGPAPTADRGRIADGPRSLPVRLWRSGYWLIVGVWS